MNAIKLSARARVIWAICDILSGQSLATGFETLLAKSSPHDRGFVHELCLGTLRQWWALCRIGESLAPRPIGDACVLAALNVGLYQLLYMRTPDHAAIHQTVEALKELDKGQATGFVNAILRKVAASPNKFAKKITKHHSLPNHLARVLKQDWPNEYTKLGQSLRTAPAVFVRVNTQKTTHEAYRSLLVDQHIDFEECCLSTQVLEQKTLISTFKIKGVSVQDLPFFDDGWVAVQDLHAQLAGAILAILPHTPTGETINLLDACTAPAGKLAHWLEILESKSVDYRMSAIDSNAGRLVHVFENMTRLGFDGLLGDRLSVLQADARVFGAGLAFDVVMLDAPCTATGVIRRHPDINLLRSESDIDRTVILQQEILDNLWQCVTDGGFLLYITCSILKAENERQMARFFANHGDATSIPITADWGIEQAFGRQCLPVINGGDGFYYCLIQKHQISKH